jgi:hypothetical protein
MFIDERVKHVGLTKLRHLNADTLRELDDSLLVLQDGDEPVAVLLSYKLYMRIQDELKREPADV